ncbi:MAG TPA: hypothetical protein VK447_04050 [Myxococcaceae bacterium]|nr:hypothetical protein [Myxococcaceae bacterium]
MLIALCTVVGSTSYAQDVAYRTRYTNVYEINASPFAANTAKSFAAAARMGHFAWTGTPPPDEQPLITQCAAHTGVSAWPGSCNPAGMVTALHANGSGSWTRDDYSETQLQTALDAQVSHLTGSLRSPNVVPLYGHADHWAINHVIWKDVNGVVVEYDIYDGGPAGERDGTRKGYEDGEKWIDPETWSAVFYKIITSVPSTDPFYRRFVTLWEPPPGADTRVVPSQRRRSPSPLRDGAKVTPALARDLALESMRLAGLTRHQDKWPILAASTPILPFEVAGMYPNGDYWDYYLVPFVDQKRMIVAMAMLEKETLRFQMATVLREPQPFRGYSHAQARQLAQSTLRSGETLGRGLLTWDPVATSEHAYSPLAPYYEFEVYHGAQLVGSTRVRSDDGQVRELPVEHMSRRLRK